MAHRILVVDDDKWVVQAIRSYLEQAHFEVITAYNGKDAIAQFERNRPDLVILDWMLPEIDGLSVAERIRRRSDVPIIMLTARTDEVDRLTGFQHGVDDYVVKPFSARELEARVRAVLRRSEEKGTPIIEVGGLRLDQEERLLWVEGKPVELPAMGFDLLAFLMELLQAVRGEDYSGFERSIDSHIKRLRQRIEPDPRNPRYILTVFGVGYKLAKGER